MGPDGVPAFRAGRPAVAYNSTNHEYLIVWQGDDDTPPLVDDEVEIFAQRLDGETAARVGPRLRVSDMGPDGEPAYDALSPNVVYNQSANEYLVVWHGRDTAPLVVDQYQVFAQRINAATGAEVGPNDFRVNRMILEAGPTHHAPPALVWNSIANEYFVAWDSHRAGENFNQILAQRLDGTGESLLPDDRIISHLSGVPGERIGPPLAAFNPAMNRYHVIWPGQQLWEGALTDEEIFSQSVAADATPLSNTDVRISYTGSDPIVRRGSGQPTIVYNSTADEFMVTWASGTRKSPDPRSGAWYYQYAQRLTGTGSPHGSGNFALGGGEAVCCEGAAAVVNEASSQYLVLWTAFPWDPEVVARRLDATGTLNGGAIVSHMGSVNNTSFYVARPAAAYNSRTGDVLVVWVADDDTAPLVDDEYEIFGRLYPLVEPFVVGLGSFGTEGGWVATRGDLPKASPLGWIRVPWPVYNATGGGTHPAMGDIDGDGRFEVILGLEAQGSRWLAILDDAKAQYRILKWIQIPWPAFNTALYPAAGDLNGDGDAEIVVGMGPGTAGWFAILDDVLADVPSITWRQVSWPRYAAEDGRTHPATGDFDADGKEEIVIGLGPGSNGWLQIFDDASSSFAHRTWHQVPWPEYTIANGTTWPAAGELTGDGGDELVVGLGTGGRGYFALFGDESMGYRLHYWQQVWWPDYNAGNGETHPAVGNVNTAAGGEIIIGLGPFDGEGGWFLVYGDPPWGRVGWPAFEQSGGGTFPAIGPRR